MTDFPSLQSKVNALKVKVEQNSITPVYLGALLDDVITLMETIDMTDMKADITAAIAGANSALRDSQKALSDSLMAKTVSTDARADATSALNSASMALDAASSALLGSLDTKKALNGLSLRVISPEEDEAMTQAGTHDPDTLYFITEEQ